MFNDRPLRSHVGKLRLGLREFGAGSANIDAGNHALGKTPLGHLIGTAEGIDRRD